MKSWYDSEVVENLKAGVCVLCGALVTPYHRYCGWHDFKWRMLYGELYKACGENFLVFAVARDRLRRKERQERMI